MDFLGLGGSSKPVSDELKSGEIFPGVVPGTTFKGPGENPLRHTVLGAGSVLAKAFRKALAERNPSYKCRLVKGGNIPPKPLFESDETFACDFDQANAIDYVVQGSTIVYVMHEFVLDYHTWQSKWPAFMRHVLASCGKFKVKMVFVQTNPFIYSDTEVGNMTEESAIEPSSLKGKVCKEVSELVTNEIKAGRVNAMIIRTAELFGPWIKSKESMLMVMVYKPLRCGGVPEWIFSCDKVQQFSYVPDVAEAIALLADTPDCFNQVWHAPTCKERYNACEWTILFADALGVKHSSPDPTKCAVGTHDRDLPLEEIILDTDDEATQESKKKLTKTREEKAKAEREKRKAERQGLPELNITLMYESFVWAQALFSSHMNEIRDTKHLHLNDMVFNCDKYCQRFDKKPTEAATCCADIVLEEGTHMILKEQQQQR